MISSVGDMDDEAGGWISLYGAPELDPTDFAVSVRYVDKDSEHGHAASVIISVTGDLDIYTVPLLRERIAQVLTNHLPPVFDQAADLKVGGNPLPSLPQLVLDLVGITFIDSAGLQLLLETRQRLWNVARHPVAFRQSAISPALLSVCYPSAPEAGSFTQRVMRLTGLDRLFVIFDTVEQALIVARKARD